jgi:hypothetical protein
MGDSRRPGAFGMAPVWRVKEQGLKVSTAALEDPPAIRLRPLEFHVHSPL